MLRRASKSLAVTRSRPDPVIFHNPDDGSGHHEDDDDGDIPRARARVLPTDTAIRSPLSTSPPAVRVLIPDVDVSHVVEGKACSEI